MNGQLRQFVHYFGVSLLALALDYACYLYLVSLRVLTLPQASVAGYAAGLVLSYFLMARRVFRNGWLDGRRHLEALLFGLSGLLGIALTWLSVRLCVLAFGERPQLAKLVAVAVSFSGVYLFRKLAVFRRALPASPASTGPRASTASPE